MAVVAVLNMPGVTQEQYDKVLDLLGPGGSELQEGQVAHIASPSDGGWQVVDVWESEEAFGRFFQAKLGKAIQESGMPPFDPPKFFPVHHIEK